MTFSQTKTIALKVLRGWHRTPASITLPGGGEFTMQMLVNLVERRAAALPSVIVASPEFAERFAETTVNPAFYGTINVVASPSVPPGAAYFVQSPNP